MGNWKLDDKFNELFHAVYVHMDQELIIICYRGTDFTNLKDLFSDIQIVLGINVIDVRIKESRNFYDKVTIKYPQHKKRVTGHSLGGTISYLVTKHRNPERCIVFNPGAGPTKGFISMMQDTLFKKPRTKKITTYRILGDAVSTLAFVGNIKSFLLKTVDPMKLHGIASFTELLNGEQTTT
ncbi:MAG: DUF2974 domain-containing protein [Candidatus Peribacteria bacterium]|nr:DUF2974 domain-containing protein [Candidatus Peribacteria bacterium]